MTSWDHTCQSATSDILGQTVLNCRFFECGANDLTEAPRCRTSYWLAKVNFAAVSRANHRSTGQKNVMGLTGELPRMDEQLPYVMLIHRVLQLGEKASEEPHNGKQAVALDASQKLSSMSASAQLIASATRSECPALW